MKSAIAALLMLTASVIQAAPHLAQWTEIGHGAGGSLAYETTTLKRDGTHVLVWARLKYIPPRQDSIARYDQLMYRVSIDCATDTMGLRGTSYLLNGVTVYSADAQTDGDLIEPDSIFYFLEQAVCK
ncbi:surface-adhesin E family protein [Paraburkholderia sediminicola]|uniref:surface-adhesin E family protein n=1 Tax=Paraburkholderia sediminicola TaxID=458836 RepID=UPI0038B84279